RVVLSAHSLSAGLSSCFFLRSSRDPRDLHSFPTRRSSDLVRHQRNQTDVGTASSTPGQSPVQDQESTGIYGVVNHRIAPNFTGRDRKSTRLNSSHVEISYAVFCLKKKTNKTN